MLTMPLDTFHMAQLPFILVACKCDQHPAHGEVDPSVVEQKAKSFIGDVSVFQTSESSPEAHRACLSVITRAAIAAMRRKLTHFFFFLLSLPSPAPPPSDVVLRVAPLACSPVPAHKDASH